MATLPDLDVPNVSGLSFINLIDEGLVSEENFDPTDFTSWGRVDESIFYDNGVECDLSPIKTVEGAEYYTTNEYVASDFFPRMRVKSDGWVICYAPTREAYFGSSHFSDGTSVKLSGWYNFYGIGGISSTVIDIFETIAGACNHAYGVDIAANSSEPGAEATFGIYDYNNPDVSNVTMIINSSSTFNWSYSSSVDLSSLVLAVNNDHGGDYGSRTTATAPGGGAGSVIDFYNQEAQGWDIPNGPEPGTEYTTIVPNDRYSSKVVISHWK